MANAEGGRAALERLFMYISNDAENLVFDQFRARIAELAPAAKEAVMTIAEQLRAEGLKQGIKQGLEQGLERGLEQGLVQGQRQMLETQMTLKFGSLPDTISTRIHAADLSLLDRWLRRVLTADTPDSVVEL